MFGRIAAAAVDFRVGVKMSALAGVCRHNSDSTAPVAAAADSV